MTDSTMVDADAAWPNIDGICGLLEVGCRNTGYCSFGLVVAHSYGSIFSYPVPSTTLGFRTERF